MSVESVEKLYNRFSTFYDLIYGIKVFNHGRELAPEYLDLFPEAHEADEEREDQYEAPRQL